MHGKTGAAEASYPMQLKLQPTQKDPSRGSNHVGVEKKPCTNTSWWLTLGRRAIIIFNNIDSEFSKNDKLAALPP